MKKKLLTFSVLPFISLAPVALTVSCSQQSRIKQKEQKYIDLKVNLEIKRSDILAGRDKNSPEGKEAIEEIKRTTIRDAKKLLLLLKEKAKSYDEYEIALDVKIEILESLLQE